MDMVSGLVGNSIWTEAQRRVSNVYIAKVIINLGAYMDKENDIVGTMTQAGGKNRLKEAKRYFETNSFMNETL